MSIERPVVTRKRFIAGAVCPHCQAQDTLALWRENQVEVVACVQCGHQQRQTEAKVTPYLRSDEQVIAILSEHKSSL